MKLRISLVIALSVSLMGFVRYGHIEIEQHDFNYSEEVFEKLCVELATAGFTNTWKDDTESGGCIKPDGLHEGDLLVSMAHEDHGEIVISIFVDLKRKRYRAEFNEICPQGFTDKGLHFLAEINTILMKLNLPHFRSSEIAIRD